MSPRGSSVFSMTKQEKAAARGVEKDIKLIVQRGIAACRKGDVMARVGVGVEVSRMLKQLHRVYFPI